MGSIPTSHRHFECETRILVSMVNAIIIHEERSEWPIALRRCVQVAVHSMGVGSNPTSDKNFECETRILVSITNAFMIQIKG